MNDFIDELSEQLIEASRKNQERRMMKRHAISALFVACGALLFFAGATKLLLNEPQETAVVAVERHNGTLTIDVLQRAATPEAIVDALKDEGLDATTRSLRTGPSLDGRLLGLSGGQAGGGTLWGLRVSEAWPGTILVLIGQTAPEGEQYEIAADAFAEGEPLHCVGWPGMTKSDLMDAADSAGIESVRFENVTNEEGRVTNLTDGFVESALAVSSDSVVVFVSSEPVPENVPDCGEG